MSDLTTGQASARHADSVQSAYMAMTRRKRLYGSVMLIVFIALMVSGFRVADGRNAGGFWDGIGNIFQFPGEVLSEAAENIANLPGLMWKFLPSLIETVNIAAAATLLGAIFGVLISLMGTSKNCPDPGAAVSLRR
jgi:phosphonate transport system permease protein